MFSESKIVYTEHNTIPWYYYNWLLCPFLMHYFGDSLYRENVEFDFLLTQTNDEGDPMKL